MCNLFHWKASNSQYADCTSTTEPLYPTTTATLNRTERIFIISATFAIRVILFPVVVKAQKNMIALNHVLPEFQRRQAQTLDPNLTKEESKD